MMTREQCLFMIRQQNSSFIQLFDWMIASLGEPAVGEDSEGIAALLRRARNDVCRRVGELRRELESMRPGRS
jgi:hypothetical protein